MTDILILYSREDQHWLEQLQLFLRPFNYSIGNWDVENIIEESNWVNKIIESMKSAKIVILLISSTFLASDFITNDETSIFFRDADIRGIFILPIFLSPISLYQDFSFSKVVQAHYKNTERFLSHLSALERQSVFMLISNKISELLNFASQTGIDAPNYDQQPCNLVEFSAFHPRKANAKLKHSFLIYAHLPELHSNIMENAKKFQLEMGGDTLQVRKARESVCLKIDTPITVLLECEEIEFSPNSITKKWDGEWTRFDFDFRPPDHLIGEVISIRVSIQIEGIEIASIKNCAIEIVELNSEQSQALLRHDDSHAIADITTQTAKLYNKIFVSYSRKDAEIARIYRLNQIARGDDVFVDTESIRSGEDWSDALVKAIKEADIFQLFWSENSAESPHVHEEWNYALIHKCPNDSCVGFIRPVYWKKPMPTPPTELSHLNFRYVPLTSAD